MQILIVGAGIAGLSLAKALEQRGMAADLVERQTGELAVGAGLYLVGNATRALQQLGLLADVAAKAVPIETQRIFDWRGKLLGAIRTQDVWRECGPCLCLPRNALHAILQAALVRTNISLGKAVTDIRQSPAGCEVTFSDGTAGVYDLVVGADGVNSAVRQITFPADAPRYLGTICWRTITRNTAGIEGWTTMLGNGRTLGRFQSAPRTSMSMPTSGREWTQSASSRLAPPATAVRRIRRAGLPTDREPARQRGGAFRPH